MNNLTATLETAKRMEALGWTKETFFKRQDKESKKVYYMPTAKEILDELPSDLSIKIESEYRPYQSGKYKIHYLCINKYDSGGHTAFYTFKLEGAVREVFNFGEIYNRGLSLAESLGKLRIQCKENGHIN